MTEAVTGDVLDRGFPLVLCEFVQQGCLYGFERFQQGSAYWPCELADGLDPFMH